MHSELYRDFFSADLTSRSGFRVGGTSVRGWTRDIFISVLVFVCFLFLSGYFILFFSRFSSAIIGLFLSFFFFAFFTNFLMSFLRDFFLVLCFFIIINWEKHNDSNDWLFYVKKTISKHFLSFNHLVSIFLLLLFSTFLCIFGFFLLYFFLAYFI